MAAASPDKLIIPYDDIRKKLLAAQNTQALYSAIVEIPFQHVMEAASLFLGMMSFYIVDRKAKVVNLGAVSRTEQYEQAVQSYTFDPTKFQLSLKTTDNDIVRAIVSGKPQGTTDWVTISRPEADPEQTRLNQASGGIAYSIIYPLDIPAGGALLFCYFQYKEDIGELQQKFMTKYAALVAEALNKTV